MNDNTTLLPIPLELQKIETEQPEITNAPVASEPNDQEDASNASILNRSTNTGAAFMILSIFLSVICVFSLFLFVFSAESPLSTRRIIGYIATDFLGIDPSSANKTIYELLMSNGDESKNQDPEQPNNPENNQSTPPVKNEESYDSLPPPTDEEVFHPIVPDNVPSGEFPIVAIDLSSKELKVSNSTEYAIDVNEFINKEQSNDPYIFSINDNMTVDPVVLIIHTHGTEAFSDEDKNSYNDNVNVPRSTNTNKNVVAVGAEMARVLNENGVPTIHCKIMHDETSYKDSYARAALTIKKYIDQYPSIKYVLDVHRDSIIGEDQTKYKPTTIINGNETAQIMLVMGSDESTPSHTEWKTNLTAGLKLMNELYKKYEAFVRPMSLRSSSYNQEFTPASMLLEIGSCGNTLSEAKNAGLLVAKELSKMIKDGW